MTQKILRHQDLIVYKKAIEAAMPREKRQKRRRGLKSPSDATTLSEI